MGGATHSALSLIRNMAQKSFDVIVVIPNQDERFENLLRSINVKYYIIGLCFKAYPKCKSLADVIKWCYRIMKMLYREYVSSKRIQSIIKQEHIDIVHTNVGPLACGYEACKKTGIPHIWHIREYGDRDFNIHMFPSKAAFKRCLRNSHVITITHDLLDYYSLSDNPNAHVVYNGVRSISDVCLSGKREKYFLCASRVSPEKGFEQTIRSFAKFHSTHTEFNLRIMGLCNESYQSNLWRLARELSIESYVFFEGYQDNVSQYMSEAMALLVASPSEGFGRMTAEAAFAGCLVVGKNTAGTKEIMEITGGFPFVSDEEMLGAMIDVCQLSEEEYLKKASFAQRQAVSHFSEEGYVDRVFSLYESIIESVI